MKKILLTLIAVMIGAISMHAQDDVYGKQQQLNEQKAQVELKQKLNRQEQKRLQQQIDSIQHEQALQAMRDSMFTLEANRVVFKYGQRAYVTPSTNFVAVKKNKATVQLSFNIPVAGPNGMGERLASIRWKPTRRAAPRSRSMFRALPSRRRST